MAENPFSDEGNDTYPEPSEIPGIGDSGGSGSSGGSSGGGGDDDDDDRSRSRSRSSSSGGGGGATTPADRELVEAANERDRQNQATTEFDRELVDAAESQQSGGGGGSDGSGSSSPSGGTNQSTQEPAQTEATTPADRELVEAAKERDRESQATTPADRELVDAAEERDRESRAVTEFDRELVEAENDRRREDRALTSADRELVEAENRKRREEQAITEFDRELVEAENEARRRNAPALTNADVELAEAAGENEIRKQLREQGANPDNFRVDFDPTTGEATAERQEQFGDFDYSAGLGGEEDEVENFVKGLRERAEAPLIDRAEDGAFVEQYGVESREAQTGTQRLLRDTSTDAAVGLGGAPATLVGDVVGAGMEGTELAAFTVSGAEPSSQVPDRFEDAYGSPAASARLDDAVSAGVQRAEQSVQFFEENPSELGGEAAVAAASAPLSIAVGSRIPGVGSDISGRALAAASRKGRRLVSPGDGADFLSDTRAQADMGSKTITVEKEIEADAEADRQSAREWVQENVKQTDESFGGGETRDLDTGTALDDADTQGLSPVERKARDRLPPEDEFQSRGDFDRELSQMMRRVESDERSRSQSDTGARTDVDADIESRTTAAVGASALGAQAASRMDAMSQAEAGLGAAAAGLDDKLRTGVKTQADIGQSVTGTRFDTDLRTDIRTDTRTDVRTDTRTNTRTDTRLDERADIRTDINTAIDTDTRLSKQTSLDDSTPRRRRDGFDVGTFDTEATAPILSAEEIDKQFDGGV